MTTQTRQAVAPASPPASMHPGRKRRPQVTFFQVFALALTFLLGVIFFFPLYWAIASALKQPTELHLVPPRWWPAVPQWNNFVEVGRVIPFYLFFRNSLVLTVLGSFGGVLSASLVGYGFSSFRFRGRNVLFLIVLSTMMLPGEVTLIPTFLIFNQLHWINTIKPLVVPNYFGGGAFSIFLFRQFFASIPKDLNDAAKIDGCSPFRFYWRILVPLSTPVIITLCILWFQYMWNDLMGPLIYLSSQEKYTISQGLLFMRTSFTGTAARRGQPMDHLLMAGSVVAMLPSLVIFFALQRYFIKGVIMTGIKG
jgi:multiple sugar transport system permease protein